jgi:hypothetical protein
MPAIHQKVQFVQQNIPLPVYVQPVQPPQILYPNMQNFAQIPSNFNYPLGNPSQHLFVRENIYEGYQLNGMRHGKGKLYFSSGGFYDGDWR